VFAIPLSKQTVNKHDYEFDGGTYEFHYALTSGAGAFKPSDALRFAWNFQRECPVVPLANANGPLPVSLSYAALETDGVVISTMKPADDGRGTIIRLWNPNRQATTARLNVKEIGALKWTLTDSLERNLGPESGITNGVVTTDVGARAFVTLRLLPEQGN